jgi:hypothetical protein
MITKLKQFGFFTYGKTIPGLTIDGKPAPYAVVNEREVRAVAGLMLLMALFSFFHGFYLQNFLYLKITVVVFFIEFFIKVVIGTKFSIFGAIARIFVRNQKPDYVGAIQKRFAWALGLLMSTIMIILLLVLDVRGPINLAMCAICITLMFLESSFGICVGCKIYAFLLKHNIIPTPEHKPVCPGNVCSID